MNTTIFLLPLTNIPQSFNITLGNTTYIMTVKWNDSPDAGWLIGFMDQITGDQIVDNIPMVCGVDLLAGLQYLVFGGQLVVVTDGDITAVPTLDNLGVACNLYFITPPDPTVIS